MTLKQNPLALVSLFAIATGALLDGQDLFVTEHVCCSGHFTLGQVLRAIQLPRAKPGKVQLLVVRDVATVQKHYAGTAHDPISTYRKRFLQEVPEMPGLAYILQSAKGASAVLWQPRTGFYETRQIWGQDVMRLADGSEIVEVGPASFGRDGPAKFLVWVWVKRPIDVAGAVAMVAEVREVLGVDSIQVVIGLHPYFWQVGQFPLVVPAFGALGEIGIRESRERGYFSCHAEDPSKEPRCSEFGRP